MRRILGAVLAVGAVAGCSNAGESLTYPNVTAGRIVVLDYFDRDASGTLNAGDTLYPGLRVALLLPGAHDTLRTAVTSATGIAEFDSVPVGTYRIVVDRHALPDSVGVVTGDTGTVRIIASQDSIEATRTIGLGYSVVSIADAHALPVGRRTWVRGVITVPLKIFGDTTSFINDSSQRGLRITNAHELQLLHSTFGDSVLVLGTVAQRGGQMVLDNGGIRIYGLGPVQQPDSMSVADARSARNGTLDAALVQVDSVTIHDTSTVNGQFVVVVSDPTDSTRLIDVLIDPALGAPGSFFPLGSVMHVIGVLVPEGTGTWGIKPRQADDFIFP